MNMISQQPVSAEEKLRQKLGTITNLPTPPVGLAQISKSINNPQSSIKEVAAIMSEDVAMSAKVLRLSNSAFYGAKHEITSIKQAVMVLGLDALKSIVLSTSVFDMFKSHKLDPEYQAKYWRHSLAVALGSKLLVRESPSLRGLDPEIAFSSGLMHDIGKLIICCYMKPEHSKIGTAAETGRLSDYQAELEILGYAHPLIGRILTDTWKLPQTIQEAVERHHFPKENPSAGYDTVVHAANFLAHLTFDGKLSQFENWIHFLPSVADLLELDGDGIEGFRPKLIEEYSRSSTFLQMATAEAA